MTESLDKPMLGGCCICLDERGWAENPLVYCDGQGCSIAVHQACYGIVSVPSGPWYCRRCEVHGAAIHLSCKLCPYQGGALKVADEKDQWAHVVCALYIPEVEFESVSSMEPIIIKNLPQERFQKQCYICEEENRPEKNVGACMDCAKTGCKLSFHVTCAQMSGLLCEVAGASNTTKYCGYCLHHFSKQKKLSPFKNLACSKVYKLLNKNIAANEEQSTVSSKSTVNESESTLKSTLEETPSKEELNTNSSSSEIKNSDGKLEVTDLKNTDVNTTSSYVPQNEANSVKSPTLTSLSSLADVASCALQQENLLSSEPKSKNSLQNVEIKKKNKRKTLKSMTNDGSHSKKPKSKKQKTNPTDNPKPIKIDHPVPISELEAIGYATAPKHSVISLSEFGDTSLEPSHPFDIGKTKPTPVSAHNEADGLAVLNDLVDQQQKDLMQFFQEFGAPNEVAQLLQTLKKLKEENALINSSVEKMTYRRDQLLAIKARLSIPLQSSFSCTPVCSNTQDTTLADSKQFAGSSEHQTQNFPYFVNKN